MGKGLHLSGVHPAGDVAGLVFLGKNNRTLKILGRDAGNADAGGLNGQNLGHAAVPKQPEKLLADILKERHVHLMVQKAVHLQHAALSDDAILPDAVLELFHMYNPLFFSRWSRRLTGAALRRWCDYL